MTRQELGSKTIRIYNKVRKQMIRAQNDYNLKCAYVLVDFDENKIWDGGWENWLIESGIQGFENNIKAYVDHLKSEREVAEEVHQAEQPAQAEAQPAVASSEESSQERFIGSSLGLLEKAIAQVVIETQGKTIADSVVSQLSSKVDKYISDNYGMIQRKVQIDLGDMTFETDEILHQKFDTILKFVKLNEPVFLTGPAGSGKNVICKQVAEALGLDFYFSGAVTQEYKITGYTDAYGNYQESQFYKAFKNGGLFMLDEMDASVPEVLVILNSAIANRYFDFPAPIGKVEAHPDFRIISAGNTFGLGADMQYVGRNQLDMASLDRFAVVQIDYDKDIEMAMAENDNELVSFIHDFRDACNRAGINTIVSYRGIKRIKKMSKVMELAEVLRTCLLKNLQKDDINNIFSLLRNRDNAYAQKMNLA